MNRKILYITVIFCYLLSFNARGDDQHDVVINITAKVVNTACTIDNKDSIAVEMGTVNSKGFAKFEPIEKKAFSIQLIDCPASISSATVKFSGVTNTASYVENQMKSSDASIGFGIALYDENDVFIDLQNNATKFNLTWVGTDTAELNFKASFMIIENNTSPGCFKGIANFDIEYE